MPSKHEGADSDSQLLCDQLLQLLQAGMNRDLERHEAKTCCSAFAPSEPRLYFVYHERRKISVWPRWAFGESDDLRLLATGANLTMGTRKKTATTWARNFPLSVTIHDDQELARLLPIIRLAGDAIGNPSNAKGHDGMIALEIGAHTLFPEGGKKTVTLNGYERSRAARSACLAHYGAACLVCGFDFEDRYGEPGRGFIHVHHIVPIASIKTSYRIHPINDLRPVCPNCHEMLHRQNPPYTIDELKSFLL